MIDVAVVMLIFYDRLPWIAAIILGRDLLLMVGYRFVVPRGYEFEVSRLGKTATWGLYASLGFVLVTEQGTWWPVLLLDLACARRRRGGAVPREGATPETVRAWADLAPRLATFREAAGREWAAGAKRLRLKLRLTPSSLCFHQSTTPTKGTLLEILPDLDWLTDDELPT